MLRVQWRWWRPLRRAEGPRGCAGPCRTCGHLPLIICVCPGVHAVRAALVRAGGKSTLLRQVCLAALLAQVRGCVVLMGGSRIVLVAMLLVRGRLMGVGKVEGRRLFAV